MTTPQIEQSLDNLISKETRLSTLALIHLLGYSEHLRPFTYEWIKGTVSREYTELIDTYKL